MIDAIAGADRSILVGFKPLQIVLKARQGLYHSNIFYGALRRRPSCRSEGSQAAALEGTIMSKTMLIDATHVEETRVAVVDGTRLVEFDYESKVRKQLKGSIFLAKVTRVEPSLQAAFVNFGGNRHGFLPFSEIHPDYFRIPVSDRDALLAAQMAELEEHDEEMQQQEAEREQRAAQGDAAIEEDDEEELETVVEVGGEDQALEEDDEEDCGDAVQSAGADQNDEVADDAPAETRTALMTNTPDRIDGPRVDEEEAAFDVAADEDHHDYDDHHHDEHDDHDHDEDHHEGEESEDSDNADAESNGVTAEEGGENNGNRRHGRGRGRGRNNGNNNGGRGRGRSRHGRADHDDQSVDTLGGDSVDGDRPFRFNFRRNYKIQEVIKRGQIMLIQVSKEERGNKGAAVTTYLSLPGRYCVLMPNSPRGGGVSRKIASFKDRKRMKDMLDDLSVPEGMSVILRTAGLARTKVEIKRDLDYLTRLWNTIREHTLKSSAPSLIYEEGNLIKRAIRDLYTRDIDEVHVQGDEGYKAAKEFMKMLMPSHAKKVQEYKNDRVPMFHKFGVENQIADIGEPVVNLKSGGYLVINPTEALVSVDVNSGRATKERHIEETALKTNLEAADEVARQLRLRDLGGLVVIDFIDMEDRRNNRKVEQRLRDALSSDRARIQVGRISSFGLLELSRQRMNPSLAEAQTEVCAHCAGTGRVRTLDFSAISIVRALEAEGIKGKAADILLTMSSKVALYMLNNKRRLMNDIENRYGFTITIVTDDSLSNTQFTLETAARVSAPKTQAPISVVASSDEDFDEAMNEDSDGEMNAEVSENASRGGGGAAAAGEDEDGEDGDSRSRRRRGRRGGRGRRGNRDNNGGEGEDAQADEAQSIESGAEEGAKAPSEDAAAVGEDGNVRPRRERGGRGRGRRGGRERGESRAREAGTETASETGSEPANGSDSVSAPQMVAAPVDAPSFSARAAVSNDDERAAPAKRDYEVVNQAPEKKKKGWWNKLVE